MQLQLRDDLVDVAADTQAELMREVTRDRGQAAALARQPLDRFKLLLPAMSEFERKRSLAAPRHARETENRTGLEALPQHVQIRFPSNKERRPRRQQINRRWRRPALAK